MIIESWEQSPDPALVLRRLFLLDDSAFPVDSVRQALGGDDLQDDRIWLGRANLATWLGQFDEAARWLDACEKRRAGDPAVWSARLDLARASQDGEGVRQAVGHLPATWFLPVEILRLRCWLAARIGDDAIERRALQTLLHEEPGNTAAWDRLAELAVKVARCSEADSLRKKKAEMNVLRERYATLIRRDDRARHAVELGRLAGQLGRRLEARGWSLIDQGSAARGSRSRPTPRATVSP